MEQWFPYEDGLLQFGHDLSAVETRENRYTYESVPNPASIRPRPFSRGNIMIGPASLTIYKASIRPRPFSRGNKESR